MNNGFLEIWAEIKDLWNHILYVCYVTRNIICLSYSNQNYLFCSIMPNIKPCIIGIVYVAVSQLSQPKITTKYLWRDHNNVLLTLPTPTCQWCNVPLRSRPRPVPPWPHPRSRVCRTDVQRNAAENPPSANHEFVYDFFKCRPWLHLRKNGSFYQFKENALIVSINSLYLN